MCRVRRRQAFTLVELLVVIGIIAVLIGILLPTLNRARMAAKSVACQANLHSLGQAIRIYAQYNGDMMPIGFWNGVGNNGTRATNWPLLLTAALDGQYGATWNTGGTGAVSRIRQSMICPEAPGDYALSLSVSEATSYLSHPRMMPFYDSVGWPPEHDPSNGATVPGGIKPYRFAQVHRSSEIALLFDGSLAPNGGSPGVYAPVSGIPVAYEMDTYGVVNGPPNQSYMTDYYGAAPASYNNPSAAVNISPMGGGQINTDATGNAHMPRFRHFQDTRMNCLMVDGHVETFGYKTATAGQFLRGNINVNPK